MKFIHLSDLHIGKRVNEFSMLQDQKYILSQIISIIQRENVKVVLISGDVYDKSIPTVEAVTVFDDFLTELSKMEIETLIISGNHDSPERLGFGSGIMQNNGVHIYSVFDGTVHTVEIENVKFHMLPFVKPAIVRRYFEETENYEDAVRNAINGSNLDMRGRNVLLAHQFVTKAGKETLRSDSESVSVGGLDNVDVSVFEGFDYVALGHIHRPQFVCDNIRYCGSPLKYSFSEAPYDKSVTVVDSVDFSVRTIPLMPLHDMRAVKGTMEQILSACEDDDANDYIHVTLTDEDVIIDAMEKVRNVYPNVMQLEFEQRKGMAVGVYEAEGVAEKSYMQLFEEFYKIQNDKDLSEAQIKELEDVIEEAREI